MESQMMEETDPRSPYNSQNIQGHMNEYEENQDHDSGNIVKQRGKNRPGFAKNGAEHIMFNPIGQAVEPDDTVARWGRYIGLEAVDHRYLPIDVFDWRNLEKSTLDAAWERAKRTIDWTDLEAQKNAAKIRHVFEKKLNDRWKGYKHTLKKIWEICYMGTEDHYELVDDRVSIPQWINLVNHWETDAAKKRAAKNKCNRGLRRMHHTTGSKTFAQIIHKYRKENGGASPSRCTLFELTHLRRNGTVVDEASGKAIRDMKNKINEVKEKKRNLQLPDSLTEIEMNEVYAHVLGKDKRGMVRGFGLGVRQEDVPDLPYEKKRRVQLEVESLRAAHASEMENVRREATEREGKITEELEKLKDSTVSEMNLLKLMIVNQQAAISKLLESSNHQPGNGRSYNTGQALPLPLFDDVNRVPNISEEGEQVHRSGRVED